MDRWEWISVGSTGPAIRLKQMVIAYSGVDSAAYDLYKRYTAYSILEFGRAIEHLDGNIPIEGKSSLTARRHICIQRLGTCGYHLSAVAQDRPSEWMNVSGSDIVLSG